MLKKPVLLILVFLVMSIGLFMLAIAPYHIYTLTLTEGLKTDFLTMKPSKASLYDGQDFIFKKNLDNGRDDYLLYKDFHFSHFQMPFPFNHPVFSLIPIIKLEGEGPRLGGVFLDGLNTELFSFMLERPYKFETQFNNQKLFLLPIFKSYILKKNEEEIWRDIFYKKLYIPSNFGKSFYESLLTLRNISYRDLVYNLFILYNRSLLFPSDIDKISYDINTHYGLIEYRTNDPFYKVEKLFILESGLVYSLSIKTRINTSASLHLRERILKEIIVKNSTPDSAISIYAQYKSIKYEKRIEQEGMIYLFSAWSHDLDNREYIRVIIMFLERGKMNLKFLRPFYEYAYKKFGTNLSSGSEIRLETADEKLKRKMKDELETEVKNVDEIKAPKFDGNFNSDSEKINYYLQKAKESKINSDEGEKMLIQE